MHRLLLSLILLATALTAPAQDYFLQDYFLQDYGPFDPDLPSPEAFLGYPIGAQHTRHDRIVAYLETLAEASPLASIERYAQTYERRPLVILTISSADNMQRLDELQATQRQLCDPQAEKPSTEDLPVFVNLGYNVHGNEPSGSEAAMLAAYTLLASQQPEIERFREEAVIFVDPVINPDGRDRHTHWANMFQGDPLVSDPIDAEHNEAWPRGRTNHYWFDLNRDWILGIHPESRGKLDWYHQWYPNVVTDFHEMGSNSTYFFEPMKPNGSKDPIMPEENYTTLNDTFASYFSEALDDIGSFYFTKEVFDGTYPGYGSSYPDLQGGLGLLFEQASSRGHVQETPTGKITFPFTIRNQYSSSLATVRAAVEHRDLMQGYMRDFFTSALANARQNPIEAYVFGDAHDPNRIKAFIDKLLLHRVEVYALEEPLTQDGHTFEPGSAFVVPTAQPQYRMVQTFFETYDEYADSVYYDASAWSLANFYNMAYVGRRAAVPQGARITRNSELVRVAAPERSRYAYLIPWEDYHAAGALYHLQAGGARVLSAFKPFTAQLGEQQQAFHYGTLMVPVSRQSISSDSLYQLLLEASARWRVPIYPAPSGYSAKGIDLGSRYFNPLKKTKAVMLIGEGTSSYEAGEVWHLLDQRVHMPITKLRLRQFGRANLDQYNVMVMVSGRYEQLNSQERQAIADWVKAGHTLITICGASAWAIRHGLVNESLIEKKKDSTQQRLAYVDAPEILGTKKVGGAIFEVKLDLTHPLAFGYRRARIPVYRNNEVWLEPSENAFSNVALYTDEPHIDGFITDENLENYLKPSASLLVSSLGRGRVVMFADNPNFRGSWFGTNRLFLNALFLGEHIRVPR